MTYDIDYFIAKFEATKPEEWCMGQTIDQHTGQRCAFGHLESFEARAALGYILPNAAGTNDGFEPKYQQATPKARILAALYDKKKEMG